MRTYEEIVSALEEHRLIIGRARPRSAKANCPVCGLPSLNAFRPPRTGRAPRGGLKCRGAGCATTEILRALGLLDEAPSTISPGRGARVAGPKKGWRAAVLFPLVDGSPLEPVCEYNVGRTLSASGPAAADSHAILSPLEWRVFTAVQGALVRGGPNVCNPLTGGKHVDGCRHARNLVPVRLGVLAEQITSRRGGSQLREVKGAVEGLAAFPGEWRQFRRGADPIARSGALVSIVESTPELLKEYRRDGGAGKPDLWLKVAPELHENLMAGRFQRLPLELVQGLTRSNLIVWITLLSHYRPGRGSDATAQFSVTGHEPDIPRWRLGMASLSPRELTASLELAAEAGNALQSAYRMRVVEAEGERLALEVARCASRAAVDGTAAAVARPRRGSRPTTTAGERPTGRPEGKDPSTTDGVQTGRARRVGRSMPACLKHPGFGGLASSWREAGGAPRSNLVWHRTPRSSLAWR